jgi:phosphatidylethanolamine-binding protein (PEBP) family uncharacterized protein
VKSKLSQKFNTGVMVLLIMAFFMPPLALAGAPGGQTPREEVRQGDQRPVESESLTAEQKNRVKAILSKYSESSLTATDAKAINNSFREAGMRNGPGLQQAIKDAGFVPEKITALDPPPDPSGNGQPPTNNQKSNQPVEGTKSPDRPAQRGIGGYSVEQAISDRAQLNTIAFDGLAFLTGDLGGNTFLPPGKVADFCGFQYMRDVDTNALGHNTSFVPRAADNMLFVLTDKQKALLIALAKEQEQILTEFAHKRFPLVKAFCRQLEGDIPEGSAGLNREAVMKYTAKVYALDGLLSYRRAEVLGGIVRSLTDKQKAYLSKMVFSNSATWPELEGQVDKRSMSPTAHVAVMTYASEMYSWYAGNVEADVYFCPERHATYFGSFFMKDIPAMGDDNFSISTSLTGDSGEAFLATLTASQRKLVTSLVDQQRQDLAEIVKTRRAIATELRRFMKASTVDKDKVMTLSKRYGELDGEIAYFYATAFAEVAKTLTPGQKKELLKLRNLDDKFTCKGAFLFSEAIAMPQIPNTDFLFVGPTASKSASSSSTGTPVLNKAISFSLCSSEVKDGGMLPVEFTGDGACATLPLKWTGAPVGTKSYALIMHHIAPDMTKWYWILYNIPANVTRLPKNVKGVGTLGSNSVNDRTEYAPPHSKGPGAKTYILTIYALSGPQQLTVPPSQVNREVLLAAMKDKILGTAELSVVYTR